MTYSPHRLGKPEGFPWSPLDGTDPADRRKALAATSETTAQAVSQATGHTMTHTLWCLRQLEIREQVKHTTDQAGVMRWTRLPENGWEEAVPF